MSHSANGFMLVTLESWTSPENQASLPPTHQFSLHSHRFALFLHWGLQDFERHQEFKSIARYTQPFFGAFSCISSQDNRIASSSASCRPEAAYPAQVPIVCGRHRSVSTARAARS